jgi:hypothetical protein
MLPIHESALQSSSSAQSCPTSQRGHAPPPQSMSVSKPSRLPSVQLAAVGMGDGSGTGEAVGIGSGAGVGAGIGMRVGMGTGNRLGAEVVGPGVGNDDIEGTDKGLGVGWGERLTVGAAHGVEPHAPSLKCSILISENPKLSVPQPWLASDVTAMVSVFAVCSNSTETNFLQLARVESAALQHRVYWSVHCVQPAAQESKPRSPESHTVEPSTATLMFSLSHEPSCTIHIETRTLL